METQLKTSEATQNTISNKLSTCEINIAQQAGLLDTCHLQLEDMQSQQKDIKTDASSTSEELTTCNILRVGAEESLDDCNSKQSNLIS